MSDDMEFEFEDVDIAPKIEEPGKQTSSGIRFSVSLIKDYRTCGAKAYGRINKLPQTKSIALVKGSSVHTSIESGIKNEKPPIDYFREAIRAEADANEISLDNEAGQEAIAECEKMLGSAWTILSHQGADGKPFYEKIDKGLVENFFRIERDGRTYVGKFDLMHFETPEDYSILDWKTNRNSPNETTLSQDLQFSMYAWAAKNAKDLKTFGKFPKRLVWLHLRGKNIGTRSKPKYQYSFPTPRTEEQVEQQFLDVVEPAAKAIERGEWYKPVDGEPCTYCGFWDKNKKRCTIELPRTS